VTGCLLLQRVLKGIKRWQRSSTDKRQPIIPAILRSIFSQLKMSNYDDMFWAACCSAYLGSYALPNSPCLMVVTSPKLFTFPSVT
jgi:hypothetical protein